MDKSKLDRIMQIGCRALNSANSTLELSLSFVGFLVNQTLSCISDTVGTQADRLGKFIGGTATAGSMDEMLCSSGLGLLAPYSLSGKKSTHAASKQIPHTSKLSITSSSVWCNRLETPVILSMRLPPSSLVKQLYK